MEDKVTISGVSTFFLFAIPAVLALAAIWWLAFGEGLHYFRRALSQEKRSAVAVSAYPLPQAPLKIKIINRKDAGVRIEKAEIDGGDLWLYYKNHGQSTADFIRFTWHLVAPDGTIIKAQEGYVHIYSDGPARLEPNEMGEAKLAIKSDPRAETLEVSMSSGW